MLLGGAEGVEGELVDMKLSSIHSQIAGETVGLMRGVVLPHISASCWRKDNLPPSLPPPSALPLHYAGEASQDLPLWPGATLCAQLSCLAKQKLSHFCRLQPQVSL